MPPLRFKADLPRSFAEHPHAVGLVAETEVRVSRYARLAAKVLLFRSPRHLRQFWRRAVANDIGSAVGAVNQLATEVSDGNGRILYLECDRRYFCVIGLAGGHCGMEIVTHESVHAGYAYEKRMLRNPFASISELDEERVAYPAGRIARGIVQWLYDNDLYSVNTNGRRN